MASEGQIRRSYIVYRIAYCVLRIADIEKIQSSLDGTIYPNYPY